MPEDHANQPAKKAAKKAAKKVAAKKAPHSPEKDARRAFEHLGRVRVLLSSAPDTRSAIDTLLTFAQRTLEDKRYKHAADLLRASEHLAFAGLLKDNKEEVSAELRKEIEHELTHFWERAADHVRPQNINDPFRSLHQSASRGARECLRAGAYRSALEYARAAEALAHVDDLGTVALPGHASKRLAS